MAATHTNLSKHPYSGKSLPTGVYRNPQSKKKPYRAKYGNKHLGYYVTVAQARNAYSDYKLLWTLK